MSDSLCALLSGQGLFCIENAPMSAWTTLRVGGPADLMVRARNARDILAVLCAAAEHATPLFVVGGGSNLLVRDGGIRGLVLIIGEAMSDARIDGDMLVAEAGLPLS
ncbi:MAG: FAD-binding protein, partial [Clostridia bacterium]|nr:FAD-binding protein [Clostridia bacterium]